MNKVIDEAIIKNKKRWDERIAKNPRFQRPEVLELHARLGKHVMFRGSYDAGKWSFRA
jgi:hypothetical protein